jgi:hypothetical protein
MDAIVPTMGMVFFAMPLVFYLVRVRVVLMTMVSFAVPLIFLLVIGVVVPTMMAFLPLVKKSSIDGKQYLDYL